MSWFMPFRRRKSASVARERLQILLTHERGADNHSDLIPLLREEVLAAVQEVLAAEPLLKIDYVELVDPKTMEPLELIDGPVLVLVAAALGETRLLDNATIAPPEDR